MMERSILVSKVEGRNREDLQNGSTLIAKVAKVARTMGAPAGGNQPVRSVDNSFLLVLIDPRPLTRQSVTHWLERGMADANVLAVGSSQELVAEHSECCDDVALIIFNTATAGAQQGVFWHDLAILNERLPAVPIIVVADRSDTDDVADALRHGVRGYIPTTLNPSVAIEAVRLVQAGGTFVPVNAFLQMMKEEVAPLEPAVEAEHALSDVFTPRQSAVLKLLQEGKSNKVIARELNMQESTVKVHVRQIMRKLKATNRTHAVVLAQLLASEAKV